MLREGEQQAREGGFYGSRSSRLNCLAASTKVPAMKKSIILVSALSVVAMALVSCASDSDVDPFRVRADTTTPTTNQRQRTITRQWNVTHNLPHKLPPLFLPDFPLLSLFRRRRYAHRLAHCLVEFDRTRERSACCRIDQVTAEHILSRIHASSLQKNKPVSSGSRSRNTARNSGRQRTWNAKIDFADQCRAHDKENRKPFDAHLQ